MGCMGRRSRAAVCAQCGYFDHPAENPQQLPPRTVLEGKYVVGRALGQGGFGITYLAWDLELSKKLAIKEYFPLQISTRSQDHLTVSPISSKNRDALDYGLNKFSEEARALEQFRQHSGVVNMVDFLYSNGTAYIVMLYVDGRDLKEYLNQHGGKIAYEPALKIMLLVMAALEDVHRAGIIHRDISPDNIYVEATGGIKILDFGATRYAMGEQSRSLSVVLKPGYAPEEQYRSRGKQGPWTDIYALGATFYRTITGRVPPEATDRLAEDDLAPPSAIGVAIPASSEAALMKSLAVKAENRFQTVTAFRQAMTPQRMTPQALQLDPVSRSVGSGGILRRSLQQIEKPEIAEPEVVTPVVNLPKAFLLTAISILVLIAFVASLGVRDRWLVGLLALAAPFGLMTFVFGKMWKSIQDGHAQMSPDSAVAFCFVPVFNVYWAFPVLWGFAKGYNSFLERHGLAAPRLNESLFLMSAAAYVIGWIGIPFAASVPTLASVLILLNACFLLPVVAMICDAVNGMGTSPRVDDVATINLFSLFCLSGDFQGEKFGVSSQEMIIGRNPTYASVVLSSEEISGRHARVWQDAANAGVWIEDMNSTNGTYCRQLKGGGTEWVRITGSKLLFVGDRFKLSGDGPEFEVKTA
jgi:serine/threonine protein kinase